MARAWCTYLHLLWESKVMTGVFHRTHRIPGHAVVPSPPALYCEGEMLFDAAH